MPLGIVGSLLGLLHPALGAPLLALAGWLAQGLNAICRLAAGRGSPPSSWGSGGSPR